MALAAMALAPVTSPKALAAAATPAGATAAGGPPAQLRTEILDPWVHGGDAARGFEASEMASGALDSHFHAISPDHLSHQGGLFWLRLNPSPSADGVPVLIVREGHDHRVQVFAAPSAAQSATPPSATTLPLKRAAELPQFGGAHEVVFLLPNASVPSGVAVLSGAAVPSGTAAPDAPGPLLLYARVDAPVGGVHSLRFSISTLDVALGRGALHARMIALVFGALAALSLGSFLIWSVLDDKVFVLYAALFCLQALYIAFLSGQGFYWPVLSYAGPLNSYAWNVPAALSGAAASLFVREIADLRRFSPRVYDAFGWLSIAFVVLAFANMLKPFGLESLVNAIGNIMFVGAAIFTLAVSFTAWRHGSRAAGWFLLAWGLLEAFTIATAAELLVTDGERGDYLLYSGLPLSMVAAAVLIALGVADRLRGQRIALTEAERRAQTDALTGVLNRRSLIERLDAACARARARGLSISLLFIDLDHFKEINDTFGHPAGDACLAAIVGPIQSELRQSDVIGRYGGEEFVVILSSADAVAARPIAERILRRVADVRIEGYGEPISLTCSIGIATSDTLGVWGQHLIARADAAVYVAKRAGRNRVQFAESAAA